MALLENKSDHTSAHSNYVFYKYKHTCVGRSMGFFAVIAIICKQIPPDDAGDLPAAREKARNVARVAAEPNNFFLFFVCFFSHIESENDVHTCDHIEVVYSQCPHNRQLTDAAFHWANNMATCTHRPIMS